MASLEARILQLEVAVAPPEVEDLAALRRRQAHALGGVAGVIGLHDFKLDIAEDARCVALVDRKLEGIGHADAKVRPRSSQRQIDEQLVIFRCRWARQPGER